MGCRRNESRVRAVQRRALWRAGSGGIVTGALSGRGNEWTCHSVRVKRTAQRGRRGAGGRTRTAGGPLSTSPMVAGPGFTLTALSGIRRQGGRTSWRASERYGEASIRGQGQTKSAGGTHRCARSALAGAASGAAVLLSTSASSSAGQGGHGQARTSEAETDKRNE